MYMISIDTMLVTCQHAKSQSLIVCTYKWSVTDPWGPIVLYGTLQHSKKNHYFADFNLHDNSSSIVHDLCRFWRST